MDSHLIFDGRGQHPDRLSVITLQAVSAPPQNHVSDFIAEMTQRPGGSSVQFNVCISPPRARRDRP
jgi:hypothetical protein